MRVFVLTAAAIGLFTSAAFAQDVPAQSGSPNPAVNSMDQNNSSTDLPGATRSSRGELRFTKAEARSHIEAKGYTHVTGLSRDEGGVWHATATKDGQSGPVSIDYQGNVS